MRSKHAVLLLTADVSAATRLLFDLISHHLATVIQSSLEAWGIIILAWR